MPPLQLARKILIIAAVEGLLLTPAHSENGGHIQSRSNSPGRHSRAPSPSSASGTIQIDYKTDLIKPLLGVKAEYKKKDREAAVEAYGIAGW